MGSRSVVRKEFQRAHAWETFKLSGKIYWGEGKQYSPRDLRGRQDLGGIALRSLISLRVFSCFFEGAGFLRNYPTYFLRFPPASAGWGGLPLSTPFAGSFRVPLLIQSGYFPRLGPTPLCCHFGSCACPKVLLSPVVLIVRYLKVEGIPPLPVLPISAPDTCRNGQVVPWGSAYCGIKSLPRRIPWWLGDTVNSIAS